MNRLCAFVGTAVVAGVVGWAPAAPAQPAANRAGQAPAPRLAAALSGSIEGRVIDERGTPVPGAMVSALGTSSAIAVTDPYGNFVMQALPSGAYVVRAHMTGFAPSRRQTVDVRSSTVAWFSVTLQRTDPLAAASGKPTPAAPPAPAKILAASLAPNTDLDPLLTGVFAGQDASAGAEDRTEKAWRLRHLPRSVLKETTERASNAPDSPKGAEQASAPGRGAKAITRAIAAPARKLSDLPLTAQLNVLTSGSFDGSSNLAPGEVMHGAANFSVAGPAGSFGDWSARVLTQADLGSWFLAGSFRSRSSARHQYNLGFSFSSQRVLTATGADRFGLERAQFAGRAAGSVYGVGRLRVAPRMLVDYGGRYSRYDYMPGGLFSPKIAVTLVPLKGLRIRAGASRRLLAPGAEEFLEPLTPGLWVPPERTFVGFSPIVSERTTQFEVSAEQDLAPGVVFAVRAFGQHTANQQVAFFSVPTGEDRHYGIANAGDVEARGWSVGLSHQLRPGVRGSVAYEVTEAQWLAGPVSGEDILLLGLRRRPGAERLHDFLTTIETEVPATATHVYLAYRVNTGFLLRDEEGLNPGLDSRFDLQVTQRLPFLDFTSARWQALVAVKNMFRDGARDSSVYDELLVVKPPTRVLGGFVVKF